MPGIPGIERERERERETHAERIVPPYPKGRLFSLFVSLSEFVTRKFRGPGRRTLGSGNGQRRRGGGTGQGSEWATHARTAHRTDDDARVS